MTNEFIQKLADNYFNSKLPYAMKSKDLDVWQVYRKDEHRLYLEFREELFKDLGIENNPKKDLLFDKAWQNGHSSGFYEVYNVALDLVELIK